MTLVAIRHLLTSWNRAGRMQGRADIPIEPPSADLQQVIAQNRRQLEELGPFSLVYCSTLQRTAQTAAAYGFIDIVREPLLDEFDFGVYEGKLREELLAAVGHEWLHAPHQLVLGEKMTDLEQRIRAFLARHQAQDRVLVFGHGCWLRALVSLQERGDLAHTNRVTLADNQILRFDSLSVA